MLLNGENDKLPFSGETLQKWIVDCFYVLFPSLTQGYAQGHGSKYIIDLR